MIERLHIKNFQSHKNSVLELHPGVNVIVGESDSGKSAILRALYWLCFGKPSGASMIRHNVSTSCIVEAELDGGLLSRERGDGVNLYKLNDEVYKGFGQSVPEPVTTFLNMNEINFMRQMDPPFLFSKTAGEVAQYLNRLINLDVIDRSLSNIKSQAGQMKRSAELAEVNIARLDEELKKYIWIEDAEEAVTDLEKRERRLQKMQRSQEQLNGILSRYDRATSEISKWVFSTGLIDKISAIEKQHKRLADKKQQHETLKKALSRVQQTQTALHSIPATKGVDRALLAIDTAYKALGSRKAAYNALRQQLIDTRNLQEKVKEALAHQARAMALYKKAMPDTCPLCDQPIRN